jgi:putative spermidine/putrescine transport system substrate-binding protein
MKPKKPITRRSFLKQSAAAGLLAGAGPLVLLPRKTTAAGQGPLVFCTYGGPYGENMQKHVIDPFVKKTGIRVIRTSTPNFAKVKAMVDTGNVEWDVVDAESRLFFRGIPQNLFIPLDWDIVGHKDELVPEGVHEYGAANVYYSTVLAWNKKRIEGSVAAWSDFFQTTGKRTVRGEAWKTFEAALLGDGVPESELYPIDAERALRKLSTVKDDIIFWNKTKMALDLFVTGEVDFGGLGAGPAQRAIKDGAPIDFTWNQALLSEDFLVVLNGSKQRENAMKFISHCMDPDIQRAFSMHYNIGPSNREAFSKIPDKRKRDLPTGPENLAVAVHMNGEYWAEHEAQLAKRFEAWLTA